ncbi:MAG TPA: hypothetical protein O0X39_03125 [Methanocorpusculum sp.]|nr:hypothetical protein [Methanocorpusculum sp.]
MEEPEEFVRQVMQIGLTENEAKVFYTVFQLKSAAIRDIYEISRVPRNKIYGELVSLEKKGFVKKTGDKPLRYAATDLDKTFASIRKAEMEKIARVEQYLDGFEKRKLENTGPLAYELQTSWAVENHLQNILRRAKSELILIAGDADYFTSKFTDAQLRRYAKKLDLYVIAMSPEIAEKLNVSCYQFNKGFLKRFEAEQLPVPLEDTAMHVVADRKAVLNINLHDGKISGSVMYLEQEMMVIMQVVFEAFLNYLEKAE